jgi:hypothetical protein
MSGGWIRAIWMKSGIVRDKERLGTTIQMKSRIVKDKERQ